jgi:hypothetical protein
VKAPAQAITSITEPDYYTFLEISTHLTGFTQVELQSTGMREDYYYSIMKEPDHDTTRLFFKKTKEILRLGTKKKIQQAIAADLISPLGKKPGAAPDYATLPYLGLAPRIIVLWYTGKWTSFNGKKEWESAIVSPEAYTRGLVWWAAETHPAGARQPGYNSWSRPPLSTST